MVPPPPPFFFFNPKILFLFVNDILLAEDGHTDALWDTEHFNGHNKLAACRGEEAPGGGGGHVPCRWGSHCELETESDFKLSSKSSSLRVESTSSHFSGALFKGFRAGTGSDGECQLSFSHNFHLKSSSRSAQDSKLDFFSSSSW